MSDGSNTFAPARNFTITTEERVRAAYGPPAYAVRRRRIEDLEEKLVRALRELVEEHDDARALAEAIHDERLDAELAKLNRLVATHNEYYPREANLPLDPPTGVMLDHGAPWKPMPLFEMDALVARARE